MNKASRQRRSINRLGAIGMTAAITMFGGGAMLRQCATAPRAPVVGAAMPIYGEMVALVNSYRAQNGVGPVAENGQLDLAAIDHSNDMAQRQVLTHTGWDGSNAGQRIRANGYSARAWGENVAYGQTTVAEAMAAWMNSAGHRANILNPAFSDVGVAGVPAANGVIYWTMVLAAP